MNQIEIVEKYINEKFSHFKKVEDGIFSFKEKDNEKILCIVKEKYSEEDSDKPLLFTNDFKLFLSDKEKKINADYYAFNFGGVFYYIKNQDIEKPKFHILRYLGEYEISNEDFVHLGIHSTYSLLDGCQKIEEYISKAKYLNMKALGICEKNSLRSVLKFQSACKKENIKPILGIDVKVDIEDKIYWIKLFVKNKEGWKNLVAISNIINVFNKKEEKDYIIEKDFREYLDNLIIILPNNFPFDKLGGIYKNFDSYYQIDTVEFLNQDYYFEYLTNIKNYFESKFYNKIKPILIGDSYYLDKEDEKLRKIVQEISDKHEFEYAIEGRYFKSIEEHINIFSKFFTKKEDFFDEMMDNAISNTLEVANKCNFEIKFEKLHIPLARINIEDWNVAFENDYNKEILNKTLINSKYNLDFFEKIIRNRMDELGHTGIQKYEERMKEEYDVIVGAGLENYFLIIWDILHWCKKNDLLTGLSRGSAAGSYIMYLMDIVKINPFDYNLLFSRFLNAGRVASVYLNFHFKDSKIDENYKDISRLETPKGGDKIAAKYFVGDCINNNEIIDIEVIYKGHISLPDVDMDLEDREKVKQFLIDKYGYEQFCLLGSYNTFKIKAALKDISRVVGSNLDYAALNVMTSNLFFKENLDANFEEIFKEGLNNSMFYNFIQENPKIINAMYWMLDTPKSSSVHPCGTINLPSEEDIFEDLPLIDQEGENMCVWTGPELDGLGYVKNDLLGLAQLAFFKNILTLIKKHKGIELDIYKDIPLDDQKVFKYLQNGWNSEVFQFNSYLLINYCKTLKPTTIDDLSAAVAAVRPGPMNNGLHLKYAKRKHGEEETDYLFGYKDFTKETYGVILFQEEIINIASYLGNLTLVEGDGLRKALGKKHMSEMLAFHDKIKPNAIKKGCSDKEFEDIWSSWVEFAKYAFNKSHSVAYAITGYISQWLKVYYPSEFWTAAFQKANDSSERKERFSQYFTELKESKTSVHVVVPDINIATTKTTFEGENIYFPLNNIKYLSNDGVDLIIEEKEKNGDFYSFEEFLDRMGKDKKLDKREMENLVLAGAFDKIENIISPIDRKRLIFELYKFLRKSYDRDFFVDNFQENELWWELKQLDLIGIDTINFNKLCNQYYERYTFFLNNQLLSPKMKVNVGGIIFDYVERRAKKKNQYFGIVTIICQNIPYTLCLWSDEWSLYKDNIIKYKGQVILCECEVTENKTNNTLQYSLLSDCIPIFLGSSEETKREKPADISFKKGDTVKLDNGAIGKIIRNASNTDITILIGNESVKTTKWNIISVENN